MSEPSYTKRRQKRMGPAPFASFEDLSDEVKSNLNSPEDRNASGSVVRLPGIREDAITPSIDKPDFAGISLVGDNVKSKMNLQPPTTPRIDISRASSSSHHDSNSSPDLFDAHDTGGAKLGPGFREEGTLDLRSSTEELDFHDHTKPRKDSQCSELLIISGRTSRLSSIGSAGSGRLSVVSGQSGLSRSPSPHKMLLETSFCGPKAPVETAEPHGTKVEVLEKVLLARRSDPTVAVLAEGIPLVTSPTSPIDCDDRKSDIKIKVNEPVSNTTSNKLSKRVISKSGIEYIYIPLKGPLPADDEPPLKQKVRQVKSATIQSNSCHKPATTKPKSATPSPLHQKKEAEPKYIRIRLKPPYMYSDEDPTVPVEDTKKPDTLQFTELKITVQEAPKTEASPKFSRKTPSPSLSRKGSFCSLFRSPESPTVPSGRRKSTLSGILRDASDNLRERTRSKSRDRDKSSNVSTAPSSTESIDSKSKQKSVFSIFKPKKAEQEIVIAKPEVVKLHEKPLEGCSVRIPLHSPTHYENKNLLQDVKTSSQDSQETVIEVARTNVEVIVEVTPQEKSNKVEEETAKTNDIQNTASKEEEEPKMNHIQCNTNKQKNVNHRESSTSKEEKEQNHIQCSTSQKEEDSSKLNKTQISTSSENVVFTTKLGSTNDIFTTKLPKEKEPNVQEKFEEITLPENQVPDEEDRYSSESERDADLDLSKLKRDLDLKLDVEPERKNLVLQDSYDDELPYVPTTLPLERSAAVPIVPIKQRSTYEMKTCPIERPRSTTPINPSCLEEYCEEVMGNFNVESVTKTIEKLKISLPRHDSVDKPLKSPRKTSGNWQEFAEKGINTSTRRSSVPQENETSPAVQPKPIQKEWINFEEIPEKRRPPKRIQTLPSRGHIEDSVLQDNVVYNYVNPEECRCECHEITAREKRQQEEDELPLLEDEVDEEGKVPALERIRLEIIGADRTSVVSDSSVDLSANVDAVEMNGMDSSLRTPFTSDLGLSSNRSSVASQDEPQSPDSESPNAFPKTS